MGVDPFHLHDRSRSFTGLLASNSAEKAWCASAGGAVPKSSAVIDAAILVNQLAITLPPARSFADAGSLTQETQARRDGHCRKFVVRDFRLG